MASVGGGFWGWGLLSGSGKEGKGVVGFWGWGWSSYSGRGVMGCGGWVVGCGSRVWGGLFGGVGVVVGYGWWWRLEDGGEDAAAAAVGGCVMKTQESKKDKGVSDKEQMVVADLQHNKDKKAVEVS
ncbi:hypothetical protein RJT34_24347 [Clitoria ternatea]|uniref:Uncharacterized protein n=1 Tax=Clitoria ternatea TaxID=43366 RepID=A0AAN9FMV6_CLITE